MSKVVFHARLSPQSTNSSIRHRLQFLNWRTYLGPRGQIPIVHYDVTREQTETDMQVIDINALTIVGLDCEGGENDKRSFNTLRHGGQCPGS
jgi:hypothetical protein